MWIINNGLKCETKRKKKSNWWRYEWKCRDVADSNQELINRTRTKSQRVYTNSSSFTQAMPFLVEALFFHIYIICGVYIFHYKYLFVVLNLFVSASFFCVFLSLSRFISFSFLSLLPHFYEQDFFSFFFCFFVTHVPLMVQVLCVFFFSVFSLC